MKQTIFVTLMILVLFSSCNKDKSETVIFSGVVIDMKDNTPMPNVFTTLTVDIGEWNHPRYVLDSTYTNEQGRYEFSVWLDGYLSYAVFPKKEGYSGEVNSVHVRADDYRIFGYATREIDHSTAHEDSIAIGRIASIHLNLNGCVPYWTYEIEFYAQNPGGLSDIPHPLNSLMFNDCDSLENHLLTYLYDPNHQIYLNWFRYNSEEDTIFSNDLKIVDLIPLDTVNVDLELE